MVIRCEKFKLFAVASIDINLQINKDLSYTFRFPLLLLLKSKGLVRLGFHSKYIYL
jgi:hypothetical protein